MTYRMKTRSPVGRMLTACLFVAALPASAAPLNYHVTDRVHLDGDVRWDYLSFDATHHRLFITRGDHVDVFDVASKQVVGTIPDTHGVHGVALAPDLDRGFTSNGQDNAVTVFELSTLKVVAKVPVGERPDAIVYDPLTKRVFTANAKGQSLTPVDAATLHPEAAIPLAGKPEFTVVDGKGLLFVNIEDKNTIAVVDTKALRLIRTYDLSSACNEPAGLAIDRQTERLWATCHNQAMVVVDAGYGGRILQGLPTGRGSDAAVFDDKAKLGFSSNGDGTLTVVGEDSPNKFSVWQTVSTMTGARTMALDPESHALYLVTGELEPAPPADPKQAPARPRFKPGSFTVLVVSP
jgi:YVTN family beta-propeller protein